MHYKIINITAAAVLLGAVPVLAQRTRTGDFNYSSSDCPGNQVLTQEDGKEYCCPGTIFGEDNERFCCVGATFEVETPTFASCFPTCTGGDGVSNIATSTQSCSTSIFFTNSDYSSLAQAAAASLNGSDSGSVTTTSSGSQSASTTSDTDSTRASSDTDSSRASSDSASTGSATQASATGADSEGASSTGDQSTGGAAMVTSGPMLGGLVAAGGLIMAL